jgi:hypothetical protein
MDKAFPGSFDNVVCQLFDHPLAIQFSFGRMIKNMQANEAAEEVAMVHSGKMPRL